MVNRHMKYSKGDLLLDYEGDLYKVLSVDSETNRYDIGGLFDIWSYRLDADVLEQSFTKTPHGTIGELVHKLLDYPMDTPISIYRASGSADLYLDSINDIEIDYEDTGGIILC